MKSEPRISAITNLEDSSKNQETLEFLDAFTITLGDIFKRVRQRRGEDVEGSLSSVDSWSDTPSQSDEEEKCLDVIETMFTQSLSQKCMNAHIKYLISDYNEALVKNSSQSMLPNSNIKPTGEEYGKYLVIDLGGSTLRVAVVVIEPNTPGKFRKDRVHTIVERKWPVSNWKKVMNQEFFTTMASRMKDVLVSQNFIKLDEIVNVGVTWSFPLAMKSHNSGILATPGKGFEVAPEISGRDLKEIIESVLVKEFNIIADVKAIVNDAVAVYAAGSFYDKFTKLAIVLGTGLNACFSLPAKRMHQDKCARSPSSLFNVELSLFGHSLIKDFSTKYDRMIDDRFEQVNEPHFKSHMETDEYGKIFQPSELMTSGRYLPELTRLAMLDLIEAGELFAGIKDISRLKIPYDGLSGKTLSTINENEEHTVIRQILVEEYRWSPVSITFADIERLKILVESVTKRAAYIVATMIISSLMLIRFRDRQDSQRFITISYIGSVLEYFNKYRALITKLINENKNIKSWGMSVEFCLIENSSVIGAAVAAAYHS